MTTYIALLRKDPDSDFGVDFPDFPGCITAGSTLEETRAMASRGSRGRTSRACSRTACRSRSPRALDVVMADPENAEAIPFPVAVPDQLTGAGQIDLTLPAADLEKLDALAEKRGTVALGAADRGGPPPARRRARASRRLSLGDAGHQQADLALVGVRAAASSPVIVPSNITRMRSASERISSSSTETSSTALPCVAHLDQALVDELDRADVDAAGRLADQQQVRVVLQLAREHQLLLVAAGERRRLEQRIVGPHVVAAHPAQAGADDAARVASSRDGCTRGRGDSRGSRSRRPEKSRTRPMRSRSSGTWPEAGGAAEAGIAERPALDPDRAARDLADAGQRLEQLRLAVAGDARDADDLAARGP